MNDDRPGWHGRKPAPGIICLVAWHKPGGRGGGPTRDGKRKGVKPAGKRFSRNVLPATTTVQCVVGAKTWQSIDELIEKS